MEVMGKISVSFPNMVRKFVNINGGKRKKLGVFFLTYIAQVVLLVPGFQV